MALIVVLVVLVLIGLAATRWGADSRDASYSLFRRSDRPDDPALRERLRRFNDDQVDLYRRWQRSYGLAPTSGDRRNGHRPQPR